MRGDIDEMPPAAPVQAEPQQWPTVMRNNIRRMPLRILLQNFAPRATFYPTAESAPPRLTKVRGPERRSSTPPEPKHQLLPAPRAASEPPLPRPNRDPPYQVHEAHHISPPPTPVDWAADVPDWDSDSMFHDMRNNMIKNLFQKGKWVQYHSTPDLYRGYSEGWSFLFEPICGNERLHQPKVYEGDVVFCEMQKIGQSSGPCRFNDRAVLRILPATKSEAEKYIIGRDISWDNREREHGWCYRNKIYGRLIKQRHDIEGEFRYRRRIPSSSSSSGCISPGTAHS